jgi:hypothetical protein
MTDAPVACTVHDGHGTPPAWRQKLIAAWLTANDIDPNLVSAAHPVTVLMVPFRPADEPDGPPWMIQVIVLHQYYVRADGAKETDLILRRPVTFQRTVPLKVPFPAETAPGDEGATRGETQGQAAQEAPQKVIRPAREARISDPRQGARQSGPLEGQAARNEGAAEEGPRRRDEAVPEPEEDRRRPQEEVGGQ